MCVGKGRVRERGSVYVVQSDVQQLCHYARGNFFPFVSFPFLDGDQTGIQTGQFRNLVPAQTENSLAALERGNT